VEADTPLLWVIREQVGLTGTKYGCGSAMRRLLVHLNGQVVRSCILPVGSVKAADKIVTIEGLSANSSHAAVQQHGMRARRRPRRTMVRSAEPLPPVDISPQTRLRASRRA